MPSPSEQQTGPNAGSVAQPMNWPALRLLDACMEAYDEHHQPKDITGDGKVETFCNRSVDMILRRMGYAKMRNDDGTTMTANQMVDYMSRKTSDWEPLEMAKAQDLANAGRVVVAGRQEAEHGHVVVVRPGIPEISGKWGLVPKVCHVGLNSYIGRGVNYAFSGDEPPKFWLLREGV